MESSGSEKAKAGGDQSGDYASVIQPIFEAKCYQCHGPEKQKGDFRMDTVEGLFKAGESELDPIVKGNAVESYLVETITVPEDDDIAMPPDGKDRLTPEETLAIMRWIWQGAKTGPNWPDGTSICISSQSTNRICRRPGPPPPPA